MKTVEMGRKRRRKNKRNEEKEEVRSNKIEEEESAMEYHGLQTYNHGQNSWDINPTAGENDAFSLPPSPRFSVDVTASNLFQHNQHC